MKKTKMINKPLSEQPQEIFISKGVEALTDAQLIAILLRTGSKNISVMELSETILLGRENNLLNLCAYSYKDLLKIKGLGTIKAMQLKCVAEISKRIAQVSYSERECLDSAEAIASKYLPWFRHYKREHFICVYLDKKCNLIADKIISVGTIDSSLVSTREIFISALEHEAVNIVVLHNHPSGDSTPSKNDFMATRVIKSAGEIMGIQLLDHIIIGDNEYYSMNEANTL